MIRSFVYSLAILMLTSFVLSGCDKVAAPLISAGDDINKYLRGNEVNIRERSYAAADYLTQQIDSYARKHDPFYVMPLTERGGHNLTSAFGRQVSDQLAERFRQLGYNVVDDPTHAHNAYALGGTYQIQRDVDIRLEVERKLDNRVIAAFDYKIPKSGSISRNARPEAQIFRSSN